MCLAGQLPPMRSAFFVAAQLLACMCAGGLISCMFPGDIKSANTTLGSGTSVAQGCFIEMFLTAQLIFVVLMLAAEKSKDTFLAPVGIGLTLFVTMLVGELDLAQLGLHPELREGMLTGIRGSLHGGIAQSGAELRMRGGGGGVPGLSLDLLGGPMPGGSSCCGILPYRQVPAL